MIGEINVIKNDKETLEIEILNCDEGIGEAIVNRLKEKDVEFTAYKKEHPFDKGIKLIVKSKKGPKKILLSTINEIVKEIGDFKKQVEKL
ncbi:MAG: RpoL/Rpb11 RNA polymerase subunit family protein [Candidatus ainarchaeum sp.]|nr:RpoL/Rpb11 RNA polymerase subunit family protein [Candidatus ainarchaeum sp.]